MKNSVLVAALVAAFAMDGQARADEVAKGKEIFERTCSNCHSTQIGLNKVGPFALGRGRTPRGRCSGFQLFGGADRQA